MRKLLLAASLAAFIAGPAGAADAPTVQSLLAIGFTVVASYPSNIGPGLFLQKGDQLYLCFVRETADTPELTTQYCKPVH